jgi:hypothetical protein
MTSPLKKPPPLRPVEPAPSDDAYESFLCMERINSVAESGLTPASALDLLGGLIAELPEASKEKMERIKTMDKLMNTARAFIETRVKTDDAAVIFARIEEMERRVNEAVGGRVERDGEGGG